ncbi:MAG: hypothetical protein ACO1HP_01690, partial [Bacteroidota bacterium]
KASAGKIHYSLFTIRCSLLPTQKLRQVKFTIHFLLFAVRYSLFAPAYAKASAGKIRSRLR